MNYCALFFCVIFSFTLNARVLTIGPNGDFANLAAAQSTIQAGDTLLLEAHTFNDGTQFLEEVHGSSQEPVVILGAANFQSIFNGGTEAIHLINCSYVNIEGIVVQGQTGNGINIDDGGDYSSPTHHISISGCTFRDMAGNGNNDFLKLSGLDDFMVSQCTFTNGGGGGSGVDMVGCHNGLIRDCQFDDPGVSGIQAKGGTASIRIIQNVFRNTEQRAINIGGSTGLQFFRPPLPDPIVDAYEAKDILVHSNVFIGNWAPIAFVGCIDSKVINNTFFKPENWAFRILQETTEPGFLACSDNTFANNIIYLESDLTEVNIGPNTAPETFILSHNLWYNESDGNWSPQLPVVDQNEILQDPLFEDMQNENFNLQTESPAIGAGSIFPDVPFDFEGMTFLEPPSIGAIEGGIISSSDELEGVENLIVYPNPVNDVLMIQSTTNTKNYSIYSLNGYLIQKGLTEESRVDVSNLLPGFYLLHLDEDKAPGRRSFIKL